MESRYLMSVSDVRPHSEEYCDMPVQIALFVFIVVWKKLKLNVTVNMPQVLLQFMAPVIS